MIKREIINILILRTSAFLVFLFLGSCAKGYVNIPDYADGNSIPEEQEARENETINRSDDVDGNNIPGRFERRKYKEERDYNLRSSPVFELE